MKKVYEIRENGCECKRYYEGVTLDQDDQDPKILETFDNLEDALQALKNYKSTHYLYRVPAGPFYGVTEIYVEEAIYDEEGEWVDGGNVWEFA